MSLVHDLGPDALGGEITCSARGGGELFCVWGKGLLETSKPGPGIQLSKQSSLHVQVVPLPAPECYPPCYIHY